MHIDRAKLRSSLTFYEEFVQFCEADSYPLTGDDYTNELSTRDVLEENIGELSVAELERLAALDDRYRASTIEDGGELLGQHYDISGLGWWWLRRPRAAGSQLHEDWGVPRNPNAK